MAQELEHFLAEPLPVAGTPALRAMWHACHGNWDAAHEEAQSSDTADAAWVHAMLHRQEGDLSNAGYWYRRACRPVFHGDIASECAAMLSVLMASPQ